MSASEGERLQAMRGLSKGLFWQAEAAERFGLTFRQFTRLFCRWRVFDDAALIARQRNRPSPRRLEASKRVRIEDL